MVFENITVGNIGLTDALRGLLIVGIGIFLGLASKYFIKKIAKSTVYPSVRKNSPGSYKRTVSGVNLSAEIVQWSIVIVFILQALTALNIFLFEEILKNMAGFIPKLSIAVIIFIIGFLISGILSRSIENSDIVWSKTLSRIFNVVFIFAVILSALEVIGIMLTPFLYIFVSVLFGIALAFALAIGIGLGLALKPEITKIINSFKKK
ncbi:hypothetical protein ACFLTE_11800 [Bacteroidota bacterium]